jgi:hypothetical protein
MPPVVLWLVVPGGAGWGYPVLYRADEPEFYRLRPGPQYKQ